jgi:hypothetical protein
MTYADTRWLWHIKVTRTDGTVTENDLSDDFNAAGYAKWASTKPGVERVELSVTFAAGEAVSPQAATVAA